MTAAGGADMFYSIMAGFAMHGMDANGTGLLNISSLTEFRGQSYAIGGDESAVTIANFVNHYNSSVKGAAQGSHVAELCYSDLCFSFFRMCYSHQAMRCVNEIIMM